MVSSPVRPAHAPRARSAVPVLTVQDSERQCAAALARGVYHLSYASAGCVCMLGRVRVVPHRRRQSSLCAMTATNRAGKPTGVVPQLVPAKCLMKRRVWCARE